MKCPNCGNEQAPEGSRFCPACGQALQETSKPDHKTEISVNQNVGKVSNGKVTGVQLENVRGNVNMESTVNQIEAKVIEGQYVDRQTITQNVLVLGSQALDQIVQKLLVMQGIDKQTIQKLGDKAVPENIAPDPRSGGCTARLPPREYRPRQKRLIAWECWLSTTENTTPRWTISTKGSRLTMNFLMRI